MNDKDKFVQGIILIVFLAILIFIGLSRSSHLKNNPRYTVGVVKKFTPNGRAGRSIIYDYYINNKLYSGSNNINFIEKKLIGKRYIVKFYKRNPNTSAIMLNLHVPDTLKCIPLDGWAE